MNADIAVALISVVPSVLWFALAAVFVLLFGRQIRDELIPKLSSFKAMGVELSFVRELMEASLTLADKSPQWQVTITAEDKERVLKRVKQHARLLNKSAFLWVDDHPENNLNERRMFRELGVAIDCARTNEEAVAMLRAGTYDLIISDIARDGKQPSGLELLPMLAEKKAVQPVIFYVGVFDPAMGVPGRAFGITNRPDELLHLTLDALERKKY